MLRLNKNAHITLHDVRPWLNGTARYNLRQTVVSFNVCILRIIAVVGQQCACNEVPIYQECTLHGIDNATCDAHMGVAPRLSFSAFYIAHSDVHATDEACFSVDNAYLSMVTIVHLACQSRETNGNKGLHFYSFALHSIEEFVANIPTTYVVIDNPDLNPLPHFVNQRISNEHAERVVIKDISIDMDVVLCPSDSAEQRKKEITSMGVNVCIVVFERQSHALIGKKMHQLACVFRQIQVALFREFKHTSLRQFVQTVLTDEVLPAVILSKEDINDDAYYRYERKHHEPSYSLCRLPIVHQNGYHGQYDTDSVDAYYNPMQIRHLLKTNHFVGLQTQTPLGV